MKRTIYRVKYHRATRLWRMVHRSWHCVHKLKSAAIAEGRQVARDDKPSQLVIHGRDGKIQTEHTYGNDPRRHRG